MYMYDELVTTLLHTPLRDYGNGASPVYFYSGCICVLSLCLTTERQSHFPFHIFGPLLSKSCMFRLNLIKLRCLNRIIKLLGITQTVCCCCSDCIFTVCLILYNAFGFCLYSQLSLSAPALSVHAATCLPPSTIPLCFCNLLQANDLFRFLALLLPCKLVTVMWLDSCRDQQKQAGVFELFELQHGEPVALALLRVMSPKL